MSLRGPFVACLAVLGCVASLEAQTPAAKTSVVILGVSHSMQLAAETYQPAVFRAFFDRVAPAAIGIERSPEQFARNDHYEFTYEIQYLAVPYARERSIPLHPIDWYPAVDDQILGFGLDLAVPPIIRPAQGFQSFFTLPDSAHLSQVLFYADAEASRREARAFSDTPAERASFDFARRMYLYRTFLQARRIARMASAYRGKTVLIIIGSQHKDDIERILADDPGIALVQPSTIGMPSAGAVDSAVRREDLLAIASFNVLALQAAAGPVDWGWIRRVVQRLQSTGSSPEVELLATRLAVMTNRLTPSQADTAYARIARAAGAETRFSWTGVKDGRRIDSFIDPFGNLRVGQRARLERARELYKLRRRDEAEGLRIALRTELSAPMQAQLDGYWYDYVIQMR